MSDLAERNAIAIQQSLEQYEQRIRDMEAEMNKMRGQIQMLQSRLDTHDAYRSSEQIRRMGNGPTA